MFPEPFCIHFHVASYAIVIHQYHRVVILHRVLKRLFLLVVCRVSSKFWHIAGQMSGTNHLVNVRSVVILILQEEVHLVRVVPFPRLVVAHAMARREKDSRRDELSSARERLALGVLEHQQPHPLERRNGWIPRDDRWFFVLSR